MQDKGIKATGQLTLSLDSQSLYSYSQWAKKVPAGGGDLLSDKTNCKP